MATMATWQHAARSLDVRMPLERHLLYNRCHEALLRAGPRREGSGGDGKRQRREQWWQLDRSSVWTHHRVAVRA